MIICFSGTGNSRRVADLLQDNLGDELVRFPPGLMRDPKRINLEVFDDRVIWVFPVHAWRLPSIVENVLKQANIHSKNALVHYMVITCGDDIGYADTIWRKLIEARGWEAGSAYSVQMPNSYVFMKGFDVDSKTLEEQKLADAVPRIESISEKINEDDKDTVDVVRGSWAWVKTYVLGPWFHHYKTKTKPFHATDACKGCGMCARNCPMGIISIVNYRPKWGVGHCVMCTRCYNCCPYHAVAYGNATEGKGQYVCPGFTLKR